MADRRLDLKIDNNLKEIKSLLSDIQKAITAIYDTKHKEATEDKQKLKTLREESKAYDEQLKKIEKAYAKQKDYNELAKSISQKFSFSNLASSFNSFSKNKITNKFSSQYKLLDIEKAKELKALASSTIHNKTFNQKAKEIEAKYKKERAGLEEQEKDELAGQSVKAGKAAVAVAIVGKIKDTLVNVANVFNNLSKNFLGVSLSIKDAWGDILDKTKQMTDMYKGMATYATGSSLITNSQARTTQMKYGLSDAQTYAFTQTTGMLGISSDEDLMYMNQSQKQVFTQYMQKYSSWYEQLMSSGALQDIQQMQLEFAMFKQEVAVELLQFVAQNKDTLLAAAKGIISILEWVMKIGTNILGGIFGGNGNSSTANTSNNVTIKVDYVDGGSNNSQIGSFVSDLSRQISTALGG